MTIRLLKTRRAHPLKLQQHASSRLEIVVDVQKLVAMLIALGVTGKPLPKTLTMQLSRQQLKQLVDLIVTLRSQHSFDNRGQLPQTPALQKQAQQEVGNAAEIAQRRARNLA